MRNHPDLQQIRNNPSRVLQAMDEFSADHDFLINIGSDKGRIVTDLIAQKEPKTMVEIGFAKGVWENAVGIPLKKEAVEE